MKYIHPMIRIALHASLIIATCSFAQQANDNDLAKNLYENALLQVENLMLTQSPSDSLIFDLLSDAKNFAGKQRWPEGTEILKAILAMYDESSITDTEEVNILKSAEMNNRMGFSESPNYPEKPSFPFQLEVGVDYSRQEFELSFVENDSTIIEELQNPYIGFLFNHNHLLGKNSISFNHRFRLDDQFIYYSLFGSYESGDLGQKSRLDFEGYFYHQEQAGYSDFLDEQLRYTWSKSDYGKRLFYVNLRGRYKWYLQADSIDSDIFSTAVNGYYEHFFDPAHSFYLNIIPEYYREQQDLGLQYFQNRMEAFYRIRKTYNQYIEIGSGVVYRNFKDNFSDEEYQNRYLSLEPRIEGEMPFNPHWGMAFKLELENRNYQTADEINPDFIYFSGEGLLQYYWEDFRSIGAGYFYERQSNGAEDDALTSLVEQEDFYSYGGVVDCEIMNLSGLLLNLEYRLSLRTYPNVEESLFSNYYSNRFIHSISAFGWIPIGNRWQVQLFANYDNDQDRDNEQNDNRSMIFNLGLIYKF